MTTIQDLDPLFDDHPSLDASLADFEPGSSELSPSPRFPNPAIGLYPSHHSGFRSDSDPESDRDDNQSLSGGGYSPPAWRRAKNGTRSSGFWDRGDMVMSRGMRSARNSRESSPEYESADDGEGYDRDETLAAAQRTRLPTGSLSPEKGRSPSPDPYPTGGGDFGRTFGADAAVNEGENWRATRSPEVQENGNNCMFHDPLSYSLFLGIFKIERHMNKTNEPRHPLCHARRSPTPHGALRSRLLLGALQSQPGHALLVISYYFCSHGLHFHITLPHALCALWSPTCA